MLKKLRRKFISINMMFVGIVLLFVFAGVCLTTYQNLDNDLDRSLMQAINIPKHGSPDFSKQGSMPFEDHLPQENELSDRDLIRFIPVYCVTMDTEGKIISRSPDSSMISDDELEQAVSGALSSGKTQGVLKNLNLRYLKETNLNGTNIAFVDMNYLYQSMRNLIITSFVIGFCALIAFFFISMFISRWALRPVEKAWQQQRQFIADASHELKTPLTVILANSSILLSNRQDTVEKQVKWVESTQMEASHMRKLVDDLLFLASSDILQDRKMFSEVDLSSIIWSNLLQFEPIAFEKGVSIDQDITTGITLLGDQTQLKQLIIILLDNACKYAGKGGKITVKLKPVQEQAILTVHNTGVPIAKENLPHIFDRFYRADKARAKSQGGYGLGLAIAKSIVEHHKGKISAESDETGTLFKVVFIK